MRLAPGQLATLSVVCVLLCGPARAETVMQQCGHQYQDAKAAGTLNGMSWNQFRSDCATRLKAQPAAASTSVQAPSAAATPVAAPAAQTANPLNPAPAAVSASAPAAPAPTTAATKETAPAATGGRAAFVAREKQCGAEWRANKVSLTAQTPGLTWPKYLSQCNARLKAAVK